MTASGPSPAWIGPVPNLLTGLRLALAVTFPLVSPGYRAAVVLAAGLSDVLDGWIARRFHAESALGRLLDGVADKAFVLASVVTLSFAGEMTWWQGLAVLARDLVVAGIAACCAVRRAWGSFAHMRPRWSGKATTLGVFAWFLALLVLPPGPARTAIFLGAAAASAASAADYLVQFFRLRPDRHRDRGVTDPPALTPGGDPP